LLIVLFGDLVVAFDVELACGLQKLACPRRLGAEFLRVRMRSGQRQPTQGRPPQHQLHAGASEPCEERSHPWPPSRCRPPDSRDHEPEPGAWMTMARRSRPVGGDFLPDAPESVWIGVLGSPPDWPAGSSAIERKTFAQVSERKVAGP